MLVLCHNPSTVYYQVRKHKKNVWSSFAVQYVYRIYQDLSLKKRSKYVTWSIKPWLSSFLSEIGEEKPLLY